MYGRRYAKKSYGSFKKRSSNYRTNSSRRGTFRRRRFTGANQKNLILRNPWQNPLPQTGKFKFTYNDQNFVATTDEYTFVTEHIFSMNSLYDPDYTGVGVQPYGYDQFCNGTGPYSQYKVYASKITVYLKDTLTDYIDPVQVTVYPWPTTTGPAYTEATDVMRIPYSRTNAIDIRTDLTDKRKVSCYCPCRKVAVHGTINEDSYASDYDSNPSARLFWHILFSTESSGTDCGYSYDVKIVYYARLNRGAIDVDES